MRDDTLAPHTGFDADSATKAVAMLEERIAALEDTAGTAAMRGNFRQVAR